MLRHFLRAVFLFGINLFPLVVFAQTPPTNQSLQSFLSDLYVLIRTAIPVVVSLAFLFFVWGIAMFILNAGNEEKRRSGKQFMIWGIVALFVLVSVWGIVNVIGGLTGIPQSGAPNLPQVPTQ